MCVCSAPTSDNAEDLLILTLVVELDVKTVLCLSLHSIQWDSTGACPVAYFLLLVVCTTKVISFTSFAYATYDIKCGICVVTFMKHPGIIHTNLLSS